MILTGHEILREYAAERITIAPFDADNLNPNSYNFRLGRELHVYPQHPVDPHRLNPVETLTIPDAGYVLQPHRLYLGHTLEVLGSDHYAPTFAARSSIARLGLFINLSASLGDIGFKGQWTLQLFAAHPLHVYASMRIGQMMWWRPQGQIILYDGKYQGSRGPCASRSHQDNEVA